MVKPEKKNIQEKCDRTAPTEPHNTHTGHHTTHTSILCAVCGSKLRAPLRSNFIWIRSAQQMGIRVKGQRPSAVISADSGHSTLSTAGHRGNIEPEGKMLKWISVLTLT